MHSIFKAHLFIEHRCFIILMFNTHVFKINTLTTRSFVNFKNYNIANPCFRKSKTHCLHKARILIGRKDNK